MLPITNSVLSFVLLTIGIVAATHVLILLGRNNTSHERYLKWSHRIWGYIFSAVKSRYVSVSDKGRLVLLNDFEARQANYYLGNVLAGQRRVIE